VSGYYDDLTPYAKARPNRVRATAYPAWMSCNLMGHSVGPGGRLVQRHSLLLGFVAGWHGQTCLPVTAPASNTGKLLLAHETMK